MADEAAATPDTTDAVTSVKESAALEINGGSSPTTAMLARERMDSPDPWGVPRMVALAFDKTDSKVPVDVPITAEDAASTPDKTDS